jgi:hypothetical protein
MNNANHIYRHILMLWIVLLLDSVVNVIRAFE